MMMTTTASQPRRPESFDAAQLQLVTLDSLACGCVLAIQRVRPSGVTIVSLEAKGPHCMYDEHRANKVIRVGTPFDDEDYETTGAPV